MKSKILSNGIYVPKKVLHNRDLEKIVDTSDEWIFERTGIRERRVSNIEGGEFPTDMAKMAAEVALKRASLKPDDIDIIVFSSVTPDYQLPNSASILQQKLGINNKCTCLDVSAACSGYVYGLVIADSMIKNKMAKNVLLVASEMLSREIDWGDRNVCILFGDGAGASIISATVDDDPSQIVDCKIGADGSGKDFFNKHYGGSVAPITIEVLQQKKQYMQMKGKEMFKVATRTMANVGSEVLKRNNLPLDDIDWIIPHQANIRIIEAVAKHLGTSMDKMIINIDKYGNTSAATIPLALEDGINDGRIKRGDNILLVAFGAGLTFGSSLIKY